MGSKWHWRSRGSLIGVFALLVTRAWMRGLFQAIRKAFVADGLNWNSSLFEQYFRL